METSEIAPVSTSVPPAMVENTAAVASPVAEVVSEKRHGTRDLRKIIDMAVVDNASDIFVKANGPVHARIHGIIQVMPGFENDILNAEDTQKLAYSVMSHEQIGRFEHKHELDLAFEVKDVTRVRANIAQQMGTMSIVCRLVPLRILTIEELGLPAVIGTLTQYKQGLVLVTGPTGSGKSTTLAAMVDKINNERPVNIITVEDPVEFVHRDKKGIVMQREIGIDTASFGDALKSVVRQNPDIILIGELRDIETMNTALQAAETGHLVFSTVHTSSAAETLDRIINLFPLHDRATLCLRMSNSLKGVVSQKLLPRHDKPGRVAGIEIMVVTPTIAKLIEDGHAGNIYSMIQEGGFWGMQTMNQALMKELRQGKISEEEAMRAAGNLTELRQMIRRPV